MSSPDYTTKTCTVCKRTLPATNEYFHNFRDGLHPRCKDCRREQQSRYLREHPDRVGAVKKRYYEAHKDEIYRRQQQRIKDNPEKARENRKRLRAKRHDEILSYHRRWKAEHREQIRESGKRYYATHKEQIRAADKRWKAANPDKVKEYSRNSRKKNADRVRAANRNRKARVRNAEGTHTVADIQEHVKGQTDSKGRLRCWWCGKVIKGAYHVDHVIPLAKGGGNGTNNLCISCPVCNQSKSDKLPGEWSGRLM